MQLDSIDKRILFELERNARIPDSKLAKLVRKSKDTIRYRIKRLESEGFIVSYRTWIDYAKLGYSTATLTFTLLNIPLGREKLILELRSDERVSWLGIAEGSWNVAASFAFKNLEELFLIKNTLVSSYADLILDVKVTFIAGVSVRDKAFLVSEHSKLTTFISEVMTVELDLLSKGILRELYVDSRLNVATIATRLKTSVEKVRHRMKMLESTGVIVRYCALPNYSLLGYDLYKAYVYLKSSTDLEKIMRYISGSSSIIHVVKSLAPWDLELVVFSSSFKEYNALVAAFTTKFSDSVRKVETAVMSEDTVLPSRRLIFD